MGRYDDEVPRRPASVGAYRRFARYYDLIYRDIVDYEGDCDYLERLFHKFGGGARVRTILDLGCGTGNHAIELARRRYTVTGIDLSAAQLREARAKVRGKPLAVKFVLGDMRRFDLRRTVDAAIAMFGGFGYLFTDRDVVSHFRSVRRHLEPGGLYAFEFWQESAAFDRVRSWVLRENGLRIIRLDDSRTDRVRHRLRMDFRFFVLDGDRLRERFRETHMVRLYALPEIRRLLSRGGLKLMAAYAATPAKKGFEPVRKDDFRVMMLASPAGRGA